MSKSSSTTNNIKVTPEYSKLVNPLSNVEYDVAKNSISNRGLHLPIIINQDNVILDGHNRLKICQELGIEPKFEVKEFQDPLQEKEFVIEINLKRRHLNNFQIAELEYKMEEIYKEKAKLRSFSNLKNVKENTSEAPNDAIEVNKEKNEETGKVSEIVAKKTGLSPRTYERAKTIIENGSEEVKEKLRQGKTKISKEYEKIQRDKKRQELLSQIEIESSKEQDKETNNCTLILGDFREKGKEIEDNSIDLIFTDPPYSREDLPKYDNLGYLAQRVLKEGGSLIAYVPQYALVEVGNIIESKGLKYRWEFSVEHTGKFVAYHDSRIVVGGKRLLWFTKGDKISEIAPCVYEGTYIHDFIVYTS